MAAIGLFVVIAILLVPFVLLRAWGLVTLWGWFIVPGLGAPPISYPVAIGIGLMLGLLRMNDVKTAKSGNDDDMAELALDIVIGPLFAVGVGWIVKGFM